MSSKTCLKGIFMIMVIVDTRTHVQYSRGPLAILKGKKIIGGKISAIINSWWCCQSAGAKIMASAFLIVPLIIFKNVSDSLLWMAIYWTCEYNTHNICNSMATWNNFLYWLPGKFSHLAIETQIHYKGKAKKYGKTKLKPKGSPSFVVNLFDLT